MGRLTKNYSGDYCAGDVNEWEITCKLGHLEDLEDELGISLEVLFKALKDGIWTKRGRYTYLIDKAVFVKPSALTIGYDDTGWFFSTYYNSKFNVSRVKDYGEIWALTEEELFIDETK